MLGLDVQPQSLVNVFAESDSPGVSALLIFFAVVVAPVTEELVFRRGFFRFARQHLPRWAALLVPALIFAALHQNLASFAPLVVLTMWMGIYPSSFSRFWEASVAAMVKHHRAAIDTAVKLAELAQ